MGWTRSSSHASQTCHHNEAPRRCRLAGKSSPARTVVHDEANFVSDGGVKERRLIEEGISDIYPTWKPHPAVSPHTHTKVAVYLGRMTGLLAGVNQSSECGAHH
eukprot:scaffold174224_cov29-Tisochrysis_lutea.AAC.1